MKNIERIAQIYSELHQKICQKMQFADESAIFENHHWLKEIGKGTTSVFQKGNIIERGGVNYSFVRGQFTPQMEKLLGEKANSYAATGISSIFHPKNPFAPIIHMNVRYFVLDNGTEWFGGGIDLTPHYIDISEAKTFHKQLAAICDKYNETYYRKFCAWADDYFYIPHRNETRGVGGIFFDRLKPESNNTLEQLIGFTSDLANSYPIMYGNILKQKVDNEYNEHNQKWQLLRRGRYVEFNLVYDRGTKFGLESNGNTESILISMPPEASWEYDFQPEKDSPEFVTLQLLKKGMNWGK